MQGDLGLEHQHQFAPLARQRQIVYQLQPSLLGRIPTFIIDPQAIRHMAGIEHGAARPLDQLGRVVTVARILGEADAATEAEQLPFPLDRLRQRQPQLLSESHRALQPHAADLNEKLVAHRTRHAATTGQQDLRPFGYHPEDPVATGHPGGLVDRLEAVQPQVQQRHLGLASDEDPQSFLGQDAIRQPGQGIVQGVVLESLLTLGDPLAHVLEHLRQLAEFVLPLYIHLDPIVALADPPGHHGQLTQRLDQIASQPQRAQQGCQQRTAGD